MAAAALGDAGGGAGRLVVAARGKGGPATDAAGNGDDLQHAPPPPPPPPPPTPGVAAAITSRLWGLVTDTAAAVADKAGKNKGRLGLPLQLASRWLSPDQPSPDAAETAVAQNGVPSVEVPVDENTQRSAAVQAALPVVLHTAGSTALLRLRSAATGVSAVSTGPGTVVVSACARDRGTTVVQCRGGAVGVVASFVAGGETEGAGALALAQQVASRVGAVVSALAPFPDPVGIGIGLGAAAGGAACRLSVDGGHVLVSAVRGVNCGLYSYALRAGAGAALVGTNAAALDGPPRATAGASRKEGASPALARYLPCVAVGRGTQVLVAGTATGAVALRPLALHPPPAESGPGAGMVLGPAPMRVGEDAVVYLFDAAAPVSAVGLATKAAPGKGIAPADVVGDGVDGGLEADALRLFRGLYVAAGCEDGTVAVWDTDKTLSMAEPLPPDPSSSHPSLDCFGCARTALFCHQLRPTERPVVCLEWLRVLPSPTYVGATGCAVLVTGARDGALHCVDVDRGGTVLAALDTVSPDGGRELLSLALSEAVAPRDAPAPAASAAAFCGFSDGSVCVVHVDVGVDGSVPGRYEGVVRLAHVRLVPLFALLTNAPSVTVMPVGAWHASDAIGVGGARSVAHQQLQAGITALCWTQAADGPGAAQASHNDNDDNGNCCDNKCDDGSVEGTAEDSDAPLNDAYTGRRATSRHGCLVTGNAQGEVRLWRATIHHRDPPSS